MKRLTQKNKTSIFVKAAIATFALFCAVMVIDQHFQINRLKEQEETLRMQILEQSYTIDELRDEYDEAFDDTYIKKIARQKLGYHMPEEILFFNDLIQ